MNHQIINEDCITGMPAHLALESVDLCVTSIPFGSLFQYSNKTEDVGNNQDGVDLRGSEFGLHLRFAIEQLYRVMKPGCNACIHVQQLLTYIVQHGFMGRRDFRGDVVEMFSRAGFEWKGEFAIPKNPQLIAKRQQLHSLQFITGHSRDSRDLAPAVNDYVLIFQKPGRSANPVKCLRHSRYNPDGWVTQEEWIKWASGVWDDIREVDVLDNWQHGRDEEDEKHVCPLQLEVIRRLVRLYTNPGELVLDPFMGIGSTAWVAIEQDRESVGFELKESYARLARRNIERATAAPKTNQATLFDVLAVLLEPVAAGS